MSANDINLHRKCAKCFKCEVAFYSETFILFQDGQIHSILCLFSFSQDILEEELAVKQLNSGLGFTRLLCATHNKKAMADAKLRAAAADDSFDSDSSAPAASSSDDSSSDSDSD